MAVTLTQRLNLPQWSAGTDSLRRQQLQDGFANLEKYAGRFEQVPTLSARPAAGIRDRYVTVLDSGVTYRDTGTAWTVVGANTLGAQVHKATPGQTGSLATWQDSSGSEGFGISAIGLAFARKGFEARHPTGVPLSAFAENAANTVARVRGAAAQTGDLLRLENNAGTKVAWHDADGTAHAPEFVDEAPVLTNTGAATIGAGWQLIGARARKCGPLTSWSLRVTRTGGRLVSGPDSNLAETLIATLNGGLGGPVFGWAYGSANIDAGPGVSVWVHSSRQVYLAAIMAAGGQAVETGDVITANGTYLNV